VVQSAASDYAALAIARGLQDIAAALAESDDAPENGGKITRAYGLLRP
jgi:hypothetical protein